jgi:hypothetical protein
MGLKPHIHLGKTIKEVLLLSAHFRFSFSFGGGGWLHHFISQLSLQLQSTFLSLESSCGLNVCGEGGEYETLTVGILLPFQS